MIAQTTGARTEAAPATAPSGDAPVAGSADTAPACATPYAAIDTLLAWQQPGHSDPVRAAACLDLSREVDPAVGPRRALLIKEVLDARGLFVKMEKVPADTDYQDARGQNRYPLFPHLLPTFVLVKRGDRWLWSADTVARVPAIHAKTFAVDLRAFAERLPAWMQRPVVGLPLWKLIALLALLLLGLCVRLGVVLLVTSQLRRLMARLQIIWGEKLLVKVARPLGALAAAAVIAVFLPAVHLPINLARIVQLSVRVLAAFSVVWLIYRAIDLFTGWLETKAAQTDTKMDDQLVPLLSKALKVFTVAVGVVFILQNLDVDVGALLAGLGIGGLAFALAAQDTVKNLFGALTIFLDQPFQIGDSVIVAGTEGVVESVGFRSVRIRAFTTALISVPNARVADSTVENYGHRTFRRVNTNLGLTYDTTPEQMQAFVDGVRAILDAHPATHKEGAEIHFRDFGESSLDVFVYFFLDVPGWTEELAARHEIFLAFLRLAKELDVDFAFPTRTLHVENLPAS